MFSVSRRSQPWTAQQAANRLWRKSAPPGLMAADRPVEKNSLTELTVKAVLQKMGVPRGPALDQAFDEVMRRAGER
jgi:hypothetical protein